MRGAIAILCGAMALFASRAARAETTADETAPEPNVPPDPEERVGMGIGVELAGGGVNQDAVVEGPLRPGTRDRASVVDSQRFTAVPLTVGLRYEVARHWRAGLRVPFVMGGGASRTGGSAPQRDMFAGGNVELGATYDRRLTRRFELEVGLGLALPTGAGTEPPRRGDEGSARVSSQASFDRYSLLRAADAVTGSTDSALYEPGRFGIVPRAVLRNRERRLHWAVSIQVENLVASTTNPASRYIGEVVVGARASYALARHVEPGLATWSNITFAAHEDRRQSVLLVEPNVRFPFTHVVPYVGAAVPVLGRFVTEKAFGVRGGVQLEF